MAYGFTEQQIEQWDWPAQAAAWREKARHEARRAAYYQHKAEQYEAKQEVTA
ncbi:hypothetical protein RI444_07630 [Paenarthrobacter sp. AT5]|uniref:hypothetical protein n=1 Tax=Paenarthrobacter TaxID=1742992 RepID=UPI001A99F98F|nr:MULTISPECIES: hypothetical protein [Paenarthrobacter]WOC62481.1 hypothetical protein RI444_07630 [Paenarthrobacter sp. AT5]